MWGEMTQFRTDFPLKYLTLWKMENLPQAFSYFGEKNECAIQLYPRAVHHELGPLSLTCQPHLTPPAKGVEHETSSHRGLKAQPPSVCI